MTRFRSGCVLLLSLAAWADGTPRIYVTPAGAALVDQRLASPEPPEAELASFTSVPGPAIRYQMNVASATTEPWIDSNGSLYERGVAKAKYQKLAVGGASLAAAEAFVYGVDAALNPAPEDVALLGKMLQFLQTIEAPKMQPLANIGVIDDGSPAIPEVLRLLTRRNLSYRVVKAPDPALDLTIKLGSTEFPMQATRNPSEFAAKVRSKLGDDRRLVRLYGTSLTIAHLTGDAKRTRLHLLNYGRSRFSQTISIRLLGSYKPVKFSGFESAAGAQLTDIHHVDGGTEFFVPPYTTRAVIDLEKQ